MSFELTFDPATASADDLLWLGGYLDIDADSNPDTGRSSIIDSYGLEPPCPMGVEYSLAFYPLNQSVELYKLIGNIETLIGTYSSRIEGMTVKVDVPRCGSAPCEGIELGASFQLSALLGNGVELTDRIPNDSVPCTALAAPADWDQDGDVDQDDLGHFTACVSGPNIAQFDPDCRASCDLDGDEDVDQDDFGEFQRQMTGRCDALDPGLSLTL